MDGQNPLYCWRHAINRPDAALGSVFEHRRSPCRMGRLSLSADTLVRLCLIRRISRTGFRVD